MGEELTLALMGDLMMGRLVDAALSRHGLRHVWGNFQPLLSGGLGRNQLVAGNLECAITTHEEKYEKEFNFKLAPTNAHVLKVAALDYVSLANNHSLDFLLPGLIETRRVLEDTGVAFSGVGRKKEAMLPAYVKKGEYKLAFFSFSDHYEAWAATDSEPGINYIDPADYKLDEFKKQLRYARQEKGADFVIVFIHWGPNWAWHPSVSVCNLAHDFAEAGVNLIFGHSAHHVQGVEIYKGVPIIYGAGGFVDDYALDTRYRNDLGFLFCVRINKTQIERIDLIPSKIEHIQQSPGEEPPYISKVMRAVGEDYQWLSKKMTQLCRFFGTRVEEREEDKGLFIEMEPHLIKLQKKRTPKAFPGI